MEDKIWKLEDLNLGYRGWMIDDGRQKIEDEDDNYKKEDGR